MSDKIKILVVDDEKVIRDMLTELLEDEGYSLTAAPSGEVALEIFRDDPDHLVIADIRMGGMSGIDLLEEVRKLDPDAMVIIITSHASLESAVATMRAGAYDYIYKPFEDLEQITQVVARAMDKIALLRKNRALVQSIEQVDQEIEKTSMEQEKLAIRDDLTGFSNRRYMYQTLKMEVSRAKRYKRLLSVIALEVDLFKAYNDRYGHPVGAEVLKIMADIIVTRLRLADMPVRYDVGTLVILLPETDWRRSTTLAEDIQAQVENFPFTGRETLPLGKVTISLGLVEFSAESDDAKSLLRRAFQALARAKSEGQNQVYYLSESE